MVFARRFHAARHHRRRLLRRPRFRRRARRRGRLPPAGVRESLSIDSRVPPCADDGRAWRPTLFKWRRYEDELSRRYEVIDPLSRRCRWIRDHRGRQAFDVSVDGRGNVGCGVSDARPPSAMRHSDSPRCPATNPMSSPLRSSGRRPPFGGHHSPCCDQAAVKARIECSRGFCRMRDPDGWCAGASP